MRPIIQFDGVGLRYGGDDEILRDVSFDVAEGSFFFITGASGAGKSSLLRLMYLDRPPSRGHVLLFGEDVATLDRAARTRLRRSIGVVFQDFRLLDHLTVIENVALPLRIAGRWSAARMADVEELLAWVGLGDKLEARPPSLSGGEQQRVAIARAVINKPALLLADEPTGNVDPDIGFRLLHLFEQLNKLGTTVLIATHNQDLIDRFPRPMLIVREGAVEPVLRARSSAPRTGRTGRRAAG